MIYQSNTPRQAELLLGLSRSKVGAGLRHSMCNCGIVGPQQDRASKKDWFVFV